MATAIKIEKASDFVNLSDEQLEALIERPGAAAAVHKDAVADIAENLANPEKEAPAEPAKGEEPAKPEAAPAAVLKPAAEVKPDAVPAEVPLLTKFVLKDPEGALDEVDAAQRLKFDFKANEKEYTDVPLDKVVKWAQMGIYNEAREQEVVNTRNAMAELAAAQQELQNQVAQYEEYTSRLFTDEGFRQRAVEAYAQQTTPEVRAFQAEQQLAAEREQNQRAMENQQIAGFVNSELVPRMTKLTENHPELHDAIVGRFSILTAPLLRNGVVPLQNLPEVIRVVDKELAPWVEAQVEAQSASAQTQDAKVQAEQVKATLAKRQVARLTSPPPSSAPVPPKAKKFKSAREWFEDTFPTAQD